MPDKSWTEVMSEANKKVEELNNDYETECLRKRLFCLTGKTVRMIEGHAAAQRRQADIPIAITLRAVYAHLENRTSKAKR